MIKNIFLSFLAAMGLCFSCKAENKIKTLPPGEYLKAVEADSLGVILDVRRPEEFTEGHLKGALSLDFLNSSAFDEGLKELDKMKHYYIYCRSGKRSHAAAETMQKQGFIVFEMEGGILNWMEKGFPVIK